MMNIETEKKAIALLLRTGRATCLVYEAMFWMKVIKAMEWLAFTLYNARLHKAARIVNAIAQGNTAWMRDRLSYLMKELQDTKEAIKSTGVVK